MSYLDTPRINFAGMFLASPATINNTPNNYDPARYNPDSFKPEKIELYWEPKGDSIFNLTGCTVTTLDVSRDDAPTVADDFLLGKQVVALYPSGQEPKLVDLDPMQQNVSEIWGMIVRIGTDNVYVQGTFKPVAFNGIWLNSQGDASPQSSASASAVYQSTLTHLTWQVGNSEILKKLQAISPHRLSIRMVVSSHNNAPQLYAFTSDTFRKMAAKGVHQNVLDKIVSLQKYVMYLDKDGNPKPGSPQGHIPTLGYVRDLLKQLLSPSEAAQYLQTIVEQAQQPYEKPRYDYNYGKLVGSIGPCFDDEPHFAVPARTLAPIIVKGKKPHPFWAQAKLHLEDKGEPSLTIDLANSLPIEMPGGPLWKEELGTLSVAYYTPEAPGTFIPFGPPIAYSHSDFIDKQSGMLVITKDQFGSVAPELLANHPIAIVRKPSPTSPDSDYQPLLKEHSEGLSMRADQFVFRMNPGMETTPTFPFGQEHEVNIYVRKFGGTRGMDNLEIQMNILEPAAATSYILGTLGTNGVNGISENNISTPKGKLELSAHRVPIIDGKATLRIKGLNPGNPRGYVDGQLYFATYTFDPPVDGYQHNPDDCISVQIYQADLIDGTPTWTNGIGDILRQYGMLYPIMDRFQLWTYEKVLEYRGPIESAFRMDVSQPLHMPVSRDLSAIKRKLILDWFKAGMPR